MLPPDRDLLLVTETPGDVDVVQRHLLRTGFDRVAGYLQQGMRGWIEAGMPFDTRDDLSVHELQEHVRSDENALQVLDVRSDEEWGEGHVPGARHVFVPFLADNLAALDRERPVAVYCGSGYRSSIAASVLERHGFEHVRNVPGSMSAWEAAGYPLETPQSGAS